MKIQRKLMQFARARGGNFAVISALVTIPLIGSIALAIDFANMEATRDSMQNAADAASLMAARHYEDNGRLPKPKEVQDFIKANTDAKGLRLTRLHRGQNGRIYVWATAPYDPFIMQAVWDKDITIKVKSVSVAGQNQTIEVAMALDITDSMRADDKIGGLKKAAKNFTNTLFDASNDNSRVKIGVVPFDDYVNVGTKYEKEPWIDTPPPGSQDRCKMTQDFLGYDQNKCQIKNVDRDGVITQERVCEAIWSEEYEICGLEWRGCVGSRGTRLNKLALQDEPFNRTSWPSMYQFPGLIDVRCGNALLPLTQDKQDVLDTIDAMFPYADTYIADGVMWGLRVLSPEAPFTEGEDPAAGGGLVRKILIVMSDGDNYVAPRMDGSIYNEIHDNRDVPMADEWTREACEHAKSEGVEIFTIAYGRQVSSKGKAVLEDCATSKAHYFDAASASALNTTFQNIAEALTQLRLVK